MRLIVTCGHRKSFQTVALMEMLQRDGHEVVGCIIVGSYSLKRIRNYVRKNGLATFKKKISAHYFRQKTSSFASEILPIEKFMEDHDIPKTSVISYCKSGRISYRVVKDLNSGFASRFILQERADILVYSGGGILRKGILSTTKWGVINAHSGPLPEVRGMNALEWSVLEGIEPHTTIHMIDSGIDTGRILLREKMEIYEDLYYCRGNALVHNIVLLQKVLNNFENYYEIGKAQKKSQGKQYFIMHRYLVEIVKGRLRELSKSVS